MTSSVLLHDLVLIDTEPKFCLKYKTKLRYESSQYKTQPNNTQQHKDNSVISVSRKKKLKPKQNKNSS